MRRNRHEVVFVVLLWFQYLGNVEVTESMRTLDSDTRIQLTR